MAYAEQTEFQDDYRKIGHDATAAFEPADSSSNPTEHASSEHLDTRAVDDDAPDEDEDLDEDADDVDEDEDDEDEYEDDDDSDDLDDEDEDEDEDEEDEA